MKRLFTMAFLAMAVAMPADAHEVRPAQLKVSEVSPDRFLIRWKVPAMGDRRVAIEPVFAMDCEEPGERVEGYGAGASVRSWRIECAGGLAGSEIGFTNLPATMIDVFVHVTFLDGRAYTGLVRPSAPVFTIPERDSEARIFGSYFALGVEHILFGWDHLLFVLGLVLLVTDGRRLVWAITGFTVAHSITLALATLEIVAVPGPPVEAVIALSILLLAVEVTRYRRTGEKTLAIRWPWAVSLTIGLLHGLGFAGALREYGVPAYAKLVSLLAFNLGVEAGQLAFVAALVVFGLVVGRLKVPVMPRLRVAATWLIGVSGAFWLVQRVVGFSG
ncbi:MAG: HupE/UreJ family protein [Candidatus Hydrogenedentes bacterium]|nr:HupE/UreJ family protein [Candidatus Hydrogenedentota bacterium]